MLNLHQKYSSAKARACESIVKQFSSSTDQMKEKEKDEEEVDILRDLKVHNNFFMDKIKLKFLKMYPWVIKLLNRIKDKSL